MWQQSFKAIKTVSTNNLNYGFPNPSIDRKKYADMYGPTVGDSIRLGDMDLFAKIEKDHTIYGQEAKFGGGKTLRDGMGVNPLEMRSNPDVVDTIINSAVIIDYTGIYKADIGIKDGKIHAIGKGGNPTMMDNIDFVVGASTESISGEGLILTAGGIDCHVHYLAPGLVYAALEDFFKREVWGVLHIQVKLNKFFGLTLSL